MTYNAYKRKKVHRHTYMSGDEKPVPRRKDTSCMARIIVLINDFSKEQQLLRYTYHATNEQLQLAALKTLAAIAALWREEPVDTEYYSEGSIGIVRNTEFVHIVAAMDMFFLFECEDYVEIVYKFEDCISTYSSLYWQRRLMQPQEKYAILCILEKCEVRYNAVLRKKRQKKQLPQS